MSRESDEALPSLPVAKGYDRSRLNALRHGILSGQLVLPWEDRDEFDALHEALIEEHEPDGLTERHLVEEVTCILWRQRRLCMAEAAAYNAGAPWEEPEVVWRALAHLGVDRPTDNAATVIRATVEGTEAELRDLAEDEAMTERALAILRKGKSDAYTKVLAALHKDTRASWLEGIEDVENDQAEDREQEQPDAATRAASSPARVRSGAARRPRGDSVAGHSDHVNSPYARKGLLSGGPILQLTRPLVDANSP